MKKIYFLLVFVCITLIVDAQITVRISDNNSFINFKGNAPWTVDRFDGTKVTSFADVNGDGKADAIAVFDDRIMVRLSDGTQFFNFSGNKPWTSSAFFGTRGTFFADVNGDGKADAIAVFDDRIMVRLSDGTQFFNFSGNKPWTTSAFFGTRGTFFADVNGDGKADAIAVNEQRVSVRLSDGTQFFNFSGNKPWTTSAFFGTRGTFFADVNGDGKADAIAVNEQGVSVRLSDGTQFFNFSGNKPWTSEPYFGTKETFFTDVNGDGKADAIVVNDDRVTVRISDGTKFLPNASWTLHPFYGLRGTYFADVNGDAKADVVALGGNPINASQPFSIDGIEIVQSIQEIHNLVPLIAGKSTVIRVYIKLGTDENFTFRGRLLVNNLTDGKSITIASTGDLTPDPGFDDDLEHKRNELTQSLNFIMPQGFNTEGNCLFELTEMTDVLTRLGLVCADCKSNTRSVFFIKSPQMELRIVGIQYTSTIPTALGTFAPTPTDFSFLQSWLTRAYPVAQINTTQGMIISSDDWPFLCDDANSQLASLKSIDIDNGIAGKRAHYISLVSDRAGFMRGCADLPGFYASSPAGPVWPNDLDGTYGDWYGGHELGHNYDRKHPGFCAGNSKDDDSYPYPNGQITNDANKFIGLDVGDAPNGIPQSIIPGTAFDIMTYCAQPQWLSNYTYVSILHQLQDETSADNSSSSGAGEQGGIFQQAQGEYLSITGIINLSRQTGNIKYVQRVHKVFISKKDDSLQAVIVLRGSNNVLLNKYNIALRRFSDRDSIEDQKALLDAIIPYQKGIKILELLYNDKIVDKIIVSKSTPVVSKVSISSLVQGEEKIGLLVKWKGVDADSKDLKYLVQLKSKEGLWETIALAIKKPQIELTTNQLKNGSWSAIRIIANDGYNSSKPAEMKF